MSGCAGSHHLKLDRRAGASAWQPAAGALEQEREQMGSID